MPTRLDLFRPSAFLRRSETQPEEKIAHRPIPRDEIPAFQGVCQTLRPLANPVQVQPLKSGSLPYIWSISAGCSQLTRRLSRPALERMRECTHLMKTEQPRNLGHVQLAVIKVTNGQIAPQLLKYFSEVQPFVRKLSCKRPLAHSQAAGNVFHEHSSMRKQRRDRVLNSRAQLAQITSSTG